MKLRNYSLVSPFDVIEGTYDRPTCKYATACYNFLKERGLLPLYVDGNFSFLNVLANFAFYSGCIAKKDVNISGNEETLERIEKNIIERLGLKTKIRPAKGGHGSVLSMAEEGGAYMARLLECMGLPRSCGRKAKAKTLEMPDYRTDLFRLATCDEVLEDEDVAKVKKLERDATAVLFSAKANPDSQRPKQYWVLNFLSRPTPEKARDFALKNLQLVNFSAPEIGLNESQIKTRRLVSGSHTSYIPISGKVLESILDGSRDLLKFSPRLQQLYNFELAFEPVVL